MPTTLCYRPRDGSNSKLAIYKLPTVLLFGLAFLLVPLLDLDSARAQVVTAEVLGTVTDQTGAVIPGAKISATNLSTALVYSGVSDSVGNYLIRSLPPGHYSMRVEFQGFKTWTVPDVSLAAADRLRQDATLETGQVAETVEVRGETPALQTESSTLGGLIGERAVSDLPLNGRNFIGLAQLVAGANDAAPIDRGVDDRRRTSVVAVNGQSGTFDNFQIDGMDNNERFIGTMIVRPSIDALQEVRVQTNAYSAELGRTAGGVINMITKSGGNQFHGTIFEFFRNEKLDARNYFANPNASKPAFKQNQFGGSIGGPIVKDRTFFFADYEGFRLRQGQTVVRTVPTLAMRQGNFSGVAPIFDPLTQRPDPANPGKLIRDRFPNDTIPTNRIDPVALNVASLYPLPNAPGLVNNFVISPTNRQRDETADARVDHHLSGSDNLFVRYSINDTETVLPAAAAGGGGGGAGAGLPRVTDGPFAGIEPGGVSIARQRDQAVQVSDAHAFSPRLALEVRYNFSRYVTRSTSPNMGTNASQRIGLTGVNVDEASSGLANFILGTYASIGDGSFLPTTTIDNMHQVSGTISSLVGAHSVKIGSDLRRRQVNQAQSSQAVGQFTFDSNFTNDPSGTLARSGNETASLLLGYPAAVTRSKYLIKPGYRALETAVFIQDDWRTTPWLTFNLGLRWEYFSPISEVANRISNVDLTHGTIIIAGQNGVSSTTNIKRDLNNFAPRFGFASTVRRSTVLRGGFGINFLPQSFGTPYALRNPPFSSLLTTATSPTTPVTTVTKLAAGLPPPTPTDPANPTGSLAPVDLNLVMPYLYQYNLTLQQELPLRSVLSVSYVGVLGRKLQSTSNGAGGPDINQARPGAGPIGPRRPYVGFFPNVAGMQYLTNWVNSSYQALQTTIERRYDSGLGLMGTYTWSHNIDDAEFRYRPDGTPQRIRGTAAGGNAALDIRHRFTFALNYDLPSSQRSGVLGAVARNWRVNTIATLQTGTQLTVSNNTPRSNTATASVQDRPDLIGDPRLPSDQRILTRWFNTSAFAPQAPGTFGTAGRAIMGGPGKINFDLSLHREFGFTESVRLQSRVEAFNMFNTPQFGNPNTNFGSPAFGSITSAGLSRNLQLALKLLF